jgi:hypothetical protein
MAAVPTAAMYTRKATQYMILLPQPSATPSSLKAPALTAEVVTSTSADEKKYTQKK